MIKDFYQKPVKENAWLTIGKIVARIVITVGLVLFFVFSVIGVAKAYFGLQTAKDCNGWVEMERSYPSFELGEREVEMCRSINIKVK